MRLAAVLVLLVPAAASAEDTGLALEMDVGAAGMTGGMADATEGGGNMYFRFGLGVQHGPIAALLHYEQMLITPDEPTLDGTALLGVGPGGALRFELRRGPGLLLQAQLGYTLRWLFADGQVQRRCAETLTCDHGYYDASPRYFDGAPWISLDLGYRVRSRQTMWPAFGLELGVGSIELDRPGIIPDARGAMIWVAAHAVIGAGNR